MEAISQLRGVPLTHQKDFSWVFLVDWILTVVVCLTMIFYMGRIYAYLVSFILEWLLWKRAKIKINVETLRISLLGGRIHFKNLSVIHKDYTISVLEGSLTWKYWLLNCRKAELIENDKSSSGKKAKLPCKISVECEGLEIFIYNRTVAYDNVINLLSKDERDKFEKYLNEHSFPEPFSDGSSADKLDEDLSESAYTTNSDASIVNDRDYQETDIGKHPKLLMFLPIELKFSRGSLLLGNKFTPSVMILSYESGKGIIDVLPPKERLDLYRNKTQMEFKNFEISIKQNIGYDDAIGLKFKIDRGKVSKLWKTFVRVFQIVTKPVVPKKTKKSAGTSDDNFYHKWKGLSLYKASAGDAKASDLDDVEFDLTNHEYAKFTSILKCPKVTIAYDVDVPGVVPHGAHPTIPDIDGPDVGNNGAPPDFALDVQIHGGSICYGPWAQRQVSHLQRVLSPVVSRTAKPIKKLPPGSRRIYTLFRMNISIMEDTTWRIPTRESSKDPEFLKHYKKTNEEYRPFGWMDLRFCKDTYANFNISVCPTVQGFQNNFHVHFLETEIRSSVNHDILLKSKVFDIDGDIGYPLGWNSKAIWIINMKSEQLEAFLLREHITLVADTLSDFSAGDPTPYELFRPFVYKVNWEMEGYSIYLNVNDHNIVNNPLDFNENCYLSLHGDKLSIDVTVPRESILGTYTDMSYEISTPMFRMMLNTPPWNTLNEFMKHKEVGRAYDFTIKGSYLLYSELDIDNVDTLVIECNSKSTVLHCYGFVMRYLTNVKMNYFGEFFNFVTSEEYTGVLGAREVGDVTTKSSVADLASTVDSGYQNSSLKNESEDKGPMKRSDLKRTTNETDIWFTFSVWDGALILPETIYSFDPCIALHFAELVVDFRSCNYYMDIMAVLNGTSIKRHVSKQINEVFDFIRRNNGADEQEHGLLSDLTIHGHRMYGLPPTEPTYFCQWDINLGDLCIDSDIEFIKGFFNSFYKIGFGYNDLENILLYDTETINDMTSLTVRVEKIRIGLKDPVMKSQSVISAESILFTLIDFENEKYSQRIDVKIPKLTISLNCVMGDGVDTSFLKFETKLRFTNFEQYKDIDKKRSEQRRYITIHDSPYHRCPFLLPLFYQDSDTYQNLYGAIAPSSSIPTLPLPTLPDTIDYIIEDIVGEYATLLETTNPFKNIFAETPSTMEPSRASFSEDDNEEGADPSSFKPVAFTEDRNHERDNYVVDVSYILLDVDPLLFIFAKSLLEQLYSENMVQVLDDIEIGIVKRLSNLQEGITSISNIDIHIAYLNLIWQETGEEGFGLYLDRIDYQMSEKSLEKNRTNKLLEVAALAKVKTVRVTVNQKKNPDLSEDRPPALSLGIEGFEVWSSTEDRQVNSLNLTSSDITIDESQMEWLFEYCSDQGNLIQEVCTSFNSIQNTRSNSKTELISKLTAASEYYQISHDPYVITKPAFIMRLSKGHVRENRSWKIITRLRHILTYLPDDWQSNIDEVLKEKKYTSAKDAKNIFMSVFSTWRNWEFSDVARSYIYGKLFTAENEKHKQNLIKKLLKCTMGSFYLTVYGEGYEVEHNFVVADANLVVDLTPPVTSLPSNREETIEITGRVGSVKGKFSDRLLKLQDLIPLIAAVGEDDKSDPKKELSKQFKMNTVLLVDKSELQLVMDQTKLISRTVGGRVSLLWENLKDSTSQAGSLVIFSQKSEVWLKHTSVILGEAQLRDFSILATTEAWSHKPTILINNQCADLHFRAMSSTEQLVTAITEIRESLMMIKERIKFKPKSKKKSQFVDQKINTVLSCYFSNVSSEVMPLSPFYIRHEAKQLDIYFNKFGSNEILLSIWDTDFFMTSHQTKEQYLRFSFGDIEIKGGISREGYSLINVDISISMIKLTFSEPRRIVNSFLQDEKLASQGINLLYSLKPLFFSSNLQKKEKQAPSIMINWTLDTSITYFGVLVPVASTYFVFELHMLLLSLTNTNNGMLPEETKATGQFSIENILFLIKERSLPIGLSKLLDFSIKVSTLQRTVDTEQSFQVESSHFRVCLSPDSLLRLMWGAHKLLDLSHYYSRRHAPNIWNTKMFTGKSDKSKEMPINFRSIHILSYKFCIGWIFQYGAGSNPGLMLGYNRLFSAYEKDFGKFTVVDAFFSVANGNTSSTFFSEGNEKDKYNRSFLPNMQISYWFKRCGELKDWFFRFHGEALDVNFVPSFMDVIESTLQSMRAFQELKKNILDVSESLRAENDNSYASTSVESASSGLAPFLDNIRSVNSNFKYDGGVFRVYTYEDIETKSEPSFEIKSPVVTINCTYKHDEDKVKPHKFRTLITVDPTHNTLYAGCAPLLMEFSESLQKMIKKHSTDEKPNFTKPSSQNVDYKRLLDQLDVAVKLTSAKQQLSLSCEPKAKVQADVGFESFLFSMATNEFDSEQPLEFSLTLEHTKASIKHIFSREVSTSFEVGFMDLTLLFTHPDVISMYGTGLVSDLSVFFNVKQLQNLYLFLDIWRFSSILHTRPVQRTVNKEIEMSSLTSTNYADAGTEIPWCFTLIFTNVSGDVDLGPSLGMISLRTQRTWLATDHYNEKRQLLHAFTDGISLTSEGRLSGLFEVANASWLSEVKWPPEKSKNTHPLVSTSLNIDDIAVKAAFDYHMFLIGTISNIHFHLHNEKDAKGVLPDLLQVSFSSDEIILSSTALVVANILDIYNTIVRMRQDNKISYMETLRDSNPGESRQPILYKDILRSLKLLRTDLSVNISSSKVQISPISLFDVEVLVIRIEKVSIRSETHSGKKLKTDLQLQVLDVSAALSTSKEELDEEVGASIAIDDYMHYASKIVGGTIIDIPKLAVHMTTLQEEKTNNLEYLFACSFSDKISVRWNLGPVDFIKEMWTTHVKALAVRRSQVANISFGQTEEELEESIKKEEAASKLNYIALEEPQIEVPQIRDLGDATPPMEWFGVNRKKFPKFTYQTAVIPVQKLVYLAEKQYVKILDDTH
ncbi:ANM_HP_G0018910.mRNA.1.CDS.1 [Saccharomyces cerevisiae]|nr:ANM_HP_G0260740.mRNA.1.CDS.1 [Saccharomyces cerevisiae]CAI5215348.1 ANM_HP_G0018910.mRNA.1.CDS.1 [Saccharomyces cerevisiae]CAI7012133.1 ANM_HP_G0260740.mRNA.1.CDS.1 [Saccharomyces cerevisiae]CAI7021033.1 ANM_HP_G0018910.mRNA.1.CDS.1 [Saccharomyces cerevisiae]